MGYVISENKLHFEFSISTSIKREGYNHLTQGWLRRLGEIIYSAEHRTEVKKNKWYGNYNKVRWKITLTVMSILKDKLWMHNRARKQQ